MDIEQLRDFCLSLPLATECFPFDETTLVFKIEGKMFLFVGIDDPCLRSNMKCNPDQALVWRDEYAEVIPGYHCNKKYWNTVTINSSLKDRVVREMIVHSYSEVVKKLRRDRREIIEKLLAEWKVYNGVS